MKIETYACDECGKRRDSDANHWWVASVFNSAMSSGQTACLTLVPWDSASLDGGGSHLCGQSCVIAAVNRFMSTGKLEK